MSHGEQANDPADRTDEQWQILSKLRPQLLRRAAPLTTCRRTVVDAILRILRRGCAWRLLPDEYPNT
jgi:transposase